MAASEQTAYRYRWYTYISCILIHVQIYTIAKISNYLFGTHLLLLPRKIHLQLTCIIQLKFLFIHNLFGWFGKLPFSLNWLWSRTIRKIRRHYQHTAYSKRRNDTIRYDTIRYDTIRKWRMRFCSSFYCCPYLPIVPHWRQEQWQRRRRMIPVLCSSSSSSSNRRDEDKDNNAEEIFVRELSVLCS